MELGLDCSLLLKEWHEVAKHVKLSSAGHSGMNMRMDSLIKDLAV